MSLRRGVVLMVLLLCCSVLLCVHCHNRGPQTRHNDLMQTEMVQASIAKDANSTTHADSTCVCTCCDALGKCSPEYNLTIPIVGSCNACTSNLCSKTFPTECGCLGVETVSAACVGRNLTFHIFLLCVLMATILGLVVIGSLRSYVPLFDRIIPVPAQKK
eukprot:gnl/Spiro4/8082_TR4254_c0_g1_i1.p2 gnl/Spiro4/8082_TR4254_c0_g1~~gnl/Spiro4/8082_TR4254_c0_g1_i1.p2  ORF type:complete len:160 (-),score=30.19 gnl/Spiro4/8082_TR4254_c0_g1_i1:62-541(-)